MPASDQIQAVLHEWTGVFMRNSMHNFLLFSKEKGVSIPQIGALFQIRRKGVCSVSDIGDELGVTNAAASQMIENLVNLDLIRRSEDPQDRRVKQLVLTEKGRKVLQESIHARQAWLSGLSALLTSQEQIQVVSALKILVEKANKLEKTSQVDAGSTDHRDRTIHKE
jgi:DNA-binding MarR family transcriptional regulator